MIRRLSWSPDGSILLTPASLFRDLQTDSKNKYTVYGFIKTDLNQPAFMLPGFTTHANCIRFNPYLYKKKNVEQDPENENPAMLDLPYRMVFAVATAD